MNYFNLQKSFKDQRTKTIIVCFGVIAAQEGDGEEDERYSQGHIAPEETAVDEASYSTASTAPVEQKGGALHGSIAQKQFRKRIKLLSGLPTATDEEDSLSLQYFLDGGLRRERGNGD